jgi:DNA-binding response OmpR family regulator
LIQHSLSSTSRDAAAEQWASHGVPNSILLTKPFAPAQLITAVSNLLNAERPSDCTRVSLPQSDAATQSHFVAWPSQAHQSLLQLNALQWQEFGPSPDYALPGLC